MMDDGVVLVAGATGTIGRAVCEHLLERGCHVIGTCHSRTPDVASCGRLAYLTGDLLQRDARKRLFEFMAKQCRRLLGLVDCLPGCSRVDGQMEFPWLAAHIDLVEMAVQRMRQTGGGSVVLLSSTAASRAFSTGHSRFYAGEKGFLESYIRAAAGEFAPEVRINGIAPGIVAQADCPARGVHARVKEDEIPIGRFTEPAEIAKIAGSMLFDWPTYTGQIMMVDGGLTTTIHLCS